MKFLKFSTAGALVLALVFFACQKSIQSPAATDLSNSQKAQPNPALAPLSLTCAAVSGAAINVTVCAGETGVPAGFSIQWETLDDYNQFGWSQANATSYRCVSLSGVPGCAANYNLAANGCVTVNIGDKIFDQCGESAECGPTDLNCGTAYIFRAFAHNVPGGLKASDKSGSTQCTTFPCGEQGCTLTQGYWKTHGPVGCATGNNTDQWFDNITNPGTPAQVTSLTIGNTTYTDLQICTILNTSAAGGTNYALAHQLIAALLNQLKGATVPSSVQDCINYAQNYFTTHTLGAKNDGTENTQCLTDYNEGTTGPGHCNN